MHVRKPTSTRSPARARISNEKTHRRLIFQSCKDRIGSFGIEGSVEDLDQTSPSVVDHALLASFSSSCSGEESRTQHPAWRAAATTQQLSPAACTTWSVTGPASPSCQVPAACTTHSRRNTCFSVMLMMCWCNCLVFSGSEYICVYILVIFQIHKQIKT